ncbi:MAG: RNA polymerase sigma factor [Candidatus Odinarchaeota archaeon]
MSETEYQHLSDEQLAGWVKHNDHAAYTELIRRYQNKLYPYLVRLVGDEDDALDLVQDTFLKVYEQIQGFDEGRKFSSWVYRIAHNSGLNHLKKHSRTLKMDQKQMAQVLDRQVRLDDFFAGTFQHEDLEALMMVVNQLKPAYKDVLLLYFYEEKSYDEISDILKLPVSTVGVRLNRAKKRLKKLYTAPQHKRSSRGEAHETTQKN